MQIGPQLHFKCLKCQAEIFFSILGISQDQCLQCENCSRSYHFGQEIVTQIQKFEMLCFQIHQSEEILGQTAVAIDVGPHQIKVPYRLLLTRLASVLDLVVGDQRVEIFFRIEPLKDYESSLA